MSEKSKSIFISSTFEDLKGHRRKLWELLGKYDVSVRGMEKFGARKEAPLATCLSEVEQCDVYLGIVAFKLGSVERETGKSFTQREYERALELKKELLIYLADEKDSRISPQEMDYDEARQKLLAFKSILKDRHTIDTFTSEDDLAQKVKRRFDVLLSEKAEAGTKVEDEYVKSKETIDEFLLLPKRYSGKEVKLAVDFVDEPFAASKAVCSQFNLEYGETLGVPVKVKNPSLPDGSIPNLFVEGDNIAEYFSLEKPAKDIEVYVSLQFSEQKIEKMKANFVRRAYEVVVLPEGWQNQYLGYSNMLSPYVSRTEWRVEEAEGAIIAKLTKILNGKKS